MRNPGLLLALAAALVAAAPAPARAHPPAPFSVERETATAQDGAVLTLKRLEVQGGIPVLLIHGLGANGDEWDLPSKSFGRALAQAGYDVWIANHRRTGKGAWRSGGAVGYSFDDLVALDVPALVARVRAATGARPFVVGHSMGGMMAQCWLEGAAYESVRVARRLSIGRGGVSLRDVFATRIEGSPARAAQRNAEVRGLVTIASPPRFDWPHRSTTVLDFWRYPYWDQNLLLRHLAWSPSGLAATYAFPEVPGRRMAQVVTDDLPNLPYVGPTLRPYLRWVASNVGRSFLSAQLLHGPNMDAQTLIEGIDEAVDDSSGAVFRQLMDGIRNRTLREAHVHDPARRPFVYADNLGAVRVPALVVGGRYDKLCNDDTLEREGFARLGSADRTFLRVDYGHVDLVIGRDAPRDVWAPVMAWLAAH